MLATAYAQTYRTNSILTASPGQLVLMLYDGVLKALALARDAHGWSEDNPRRLEVMNAQLIKAQQIISELQGGLNHEVGGEFSRTMQRLYDYHNRRLFEANLRKSAEPIIEVERLVTQLRDAWAEMLQKQSAEPVGAVQGMA